MPFCPSCGAKLKDGAKFCMSCGEELNLTPEHEPRVSEKKNEGMALMDWTALFLFVGALVNFVPIVFITSGIASAYQNPADTTSTDTNACATGLINMSVTCGIVWVLFSFLQMGAAYFTYTGKYWGIAAIGSLLGFLNSIMLLVMGAMISGTLPGCWWISIAGFVFSLLGMIGVLSLKKEFEGKEPARKAETGVREEGKIVGASEERTPPSEKSEKVGEKEQKKEEPPVEKKAPMFVNLNEERISPKLSNREQARYLPLIDKFEIEREMRCPECGYEHTARLLYSKDVEFADGTCPRCKNVYKVALRAKDDSKKVMNNRTTEQTNVRTCPHCSAKIEGCPKFCSECGRRFD